MGNSRPWGFRRNCSLKQQPATELILPRSRLKESHSGSLVEEHLGLHPDGAGAGRSAEPFDMPQMRAGPESIPLIPLELEFGPLPEVTWKGVELVRKVG